MEKATTAGVLVSDEARIRWLHRPPLHLKVERTDREALPYLSSLWVGHLSDPPLEDAYAVLDEICRLVWIRLGAKDDSRTTIEEVTAWFSALDIAATVQDAVEAEAARYFHAEAVLRASASSLAALRSAAANLPKAPNL